MSTSHSVPLRMALCAAFGIVVPAIGAGFALEEGSARGNVNPAGLIAGGGEPASLYFNFATATELPGTQVALGASFMVGSHRVDGVRLRLVSSRGREQAIAPREVKILRYLVEHAGE